MGWLEDLLNENNKAPEPMMSMMSKEQQESVPVGFPSDYKPSVSAMDLVPDMERAPAAVAPKPQAPEQVKTEMNPMVKEHLMKNVIPSKFSEEARMSLMDRQAKDNEGVDWKAGLAGLAGALQDYGRGGNKAFENVQAVKDARRKGQESELVNFDKGALAEKKMREDDPMSDESKMAQELALKMGMSPEKVQGLSASKFKEFSPTLAKMLDIENQKLNREEARADRREDRSIRREANDIARGDRMALQDEKRELRLDALNTPFGRANTPDDAKKIKEGTETKRAFDEKLKEMIALREKHGGGAIFNRDDVGRAKALSKDLLVDYKKMAALGVMSDSDRELLEQIIPSDPLAYDFVPGQDPILHKMKKFKDDSDKDFSTRVDTRVKNRNDVALPGSTNSAGKPKKVVQNGHTYILNEATGEYE